MRTLAMTDSEIRRRYREIKPNCHPVSILAQLNATTNDHIREIVGIPEKGKNMSKVNYCEVEELYNQGKSDADICKSLKISAPSVADWRKKNNLQPNGRATKKVEKEPVQVVQESEQHIVDPVVQQILDDMIAGAGDSFEEMETSDNRSVQTDEFNEVVRMGIIEVDEPAPEDWMIEIENLQMDLMISEQERKQLEKDNSDLYKKITDLLIENARKSGFIEGVKFLHCS